MAAPIRSFPEGRSTWRARWHTRELLERRALRTRWERLRRRTAGGAGEGRTSPRCTQASVPPAGGTYAVTRQAWRCCCCSPAARPPGGGGCGGGTAGCQRSLGRGGARGGAPRRRRMRQPSTDEDLQRGGAGDFVLLHTTHRARQGTQGRPRRRSACASGHAAARRTRCVWRRHAYVPCGVVCCSAGALEVWRLRGWLARASGPAATVGGCGRPHATRASRASRRLQADPR
jgi:hypothetical protein